MRGCDFASGYPLCCSALNGVIIFIIIVKATV